MKCEYIDSGAELSFADIFGTEDATEIMSLNVGKKMPSDTAGQSGREQI